MTDPDLTPGGPATGYRRSLHVIALLTACTMFPLIFVGAGVTSKEAGMAFPDWPTSNSHLINPPQWWQQDDTRWEHGHRLIGWVVGMLAIALVITAWRGGRVRRMLAVSTLLAIILQGVLGGVRVIEDSRWLAMFHGIWGQVCFCLACTMVLLSSRTWLNGGGLHRVPSANTLQRLSLATTAAIFIQLILGAALRHWGTDLALVAHILWAICVALLIGWVVLWVIGQYPQRDIIETLGWMLGLLMVLQLGLGGVALMITVMGGVRSEFLVWAIPSAHVAVGALLLAGFVLLTLSTFHMLRPAVTGKESSATPATLATS